MTNLDEDAHNYTDKVVKRWEGHTQTLISAVGLALMFWIGTSVVELGKEVSVLSVEVRQIADIKTQITHLQVSMESDKEEHSQIKERVALLEYRSYKELPK